MKARVRYAPSPTGLQHIGSVRTALFNYLFARSQGGSFILRLEDTDRARYSEAYVKNLYDTFKWLGFYWDEGPDTGGPKAPYIQSERFDIYRKHAEQLVQMGKAYYCFCSDDKKFKDNEPENEEIETAGGYGYTRTCRSIDPIEARKRVQLGQAHVIRLKIPLEGSTSFDDVLLGRIEWKNTDINPDPVLLKSDGYPTYHLANVVDDHLMDITHVMRAQEWISSAPLHIIMYEAFGWKAPVLCHLPMVLGEDGHKLSKRHGATAVDEFRKKGYLPAALINYVAMLGCSYEEGRDLFSLPELEKLFLMEKINKAPAIFDYVKLEWFNGQYIRMLTDAELASLVLPYLAEASYISQPPTQKENELLLKLAPLIRDRLRFLSEAPKMLKFLFEEPELPEAVEFIPKKKDALFAYGMLEQALQLLGQADLHDHDACEAAFRAEAEKLGCKLGDLLMPLRVALTGTKVSPPLFHSMALMDRQIIEKRIGAAMEHLKNLEHVGRAKDE